MHFEINEIVYGVISKSRYANNFQLRIKSAEQTKEYYQDFVLDIMPTKVIVNDIAYLRNELDHLFIDQTLVDKKGIFIIKGNTDGLYTGELYKVPLGNGKSIQVKADNELSHHKSDISSFKVA